MTKQPTPDEPEETDPIEADREYYRSVLREMTEISVNLGRMIHDYAKTIPGIDLTEPLERLNRNIRRNIMLAERLAVPLKAQAKIDRVAARRQIIRDVEDAIEQKAPPGEAEKLQAELLERLEMPDIEYDITHRPIAEIVAVICRDFGIAAGCGDHPGKRRMPHDIAMLNARAARRRPPPPTGTDPPEPGD